jgi:prepilin-type N-terminal cleavage/methylation domain-containing protein
VACCSRGVATSLLHRRKGSPRTSRAGFTLIELMIVVVIVGVTAALVAPAVMRTMGIARANRAQYDAARMFRAARTNAIGTGRAHLVELVPTAGNVQLNVYIGDSSSCSRSCWTGGACGAAIVGAAAPVDGIAESNYTRDPHGVLMRYLPGPGGTVPRQVCFEPQGERWQRAGTTGPFTRGTATLIFAIDRLEGGGMAGDPQRQVVMPQYGTARVLR